MTKRINAKDFNYIWEPSIAHRKDDWKKAYLMEKLDNGSYCVHESLKTWLVVLLFVPATIFTFFSCLWDGGLIEFEFPSNPKHDWKLDIYDKKYIKDFFERADKIWEKA